MYCARCKREVFGGSICHLCGGPLVETGEVTEISPTKPRLEIVTRKKHKVGKEFGQGLPGRLLRLLIEIAAFCTLFVLLSLVVVRFANWLSENTALPGVRPKYIDIRSRWMRYFWFIGCCAIVFVTVKLRFRPGK